MNQTLSLNFQNLVLFMIIGTKSSKSWCLLSNIFAIFINLGISVRDYRTRRPGNSRSKERHVTKPQTSHNNVQKNRPRYLNLEIFFWHVKKQCCTRTVQDQDGLLLCACMR